MRLSGKRQGLRYHQAAVLLVAVLTAITAVSGCTTGDVQPGQEDHQGGEVQPTYSPPAHVSVAAGAPDPNPPAEVVRLVFVHHSSGENWLADDNGGLGVALLNNNYSVSDTGYDWGPQDPKLEGPIGSFTDTGHWYNWFLGPNRDKYLNALYAEGGLHAYYSRTTEQPAGENRVVVFKSCFPNSALGGSPRDAPTVGENPLRGEASGSEYQTVANAKGIYVDLLQYFATRQDKLFVVVTAPPLHRSETTAQQAANARAFNDWLVNDWLKDYPHKNVAVFDFYGVLTTNGGNVNRNDLGSEAGNHHRYADGQIEHLSTAGNDYSAYAVAGDSHPTAAGNQKAAAEFLPLLNAAYHRWTSA